MVIYFTGTGNSRFAAEKIAEITGDSLLDSAAYTKVGEGMDLLSEDKLVIVAPVYASAPPEPLLAALKKSAFKKDAQAYFFMTYGSEIGACDRYYIKLCQEKGLKYMGTTGVVLPQNYLMYFRMRTQDECRNLVKDSQDVIAKAGELIKEGKTFDDKLSKTMVYALAKITYPVYDKFFMKADQFYATDECIGCGKCAKVCPLGCIEMVDKRPKWSGRCTHCTACINLCPKEAIEFGKHTAGKIRYHGPKSVS